MLCPECGMERKEEDFMKKDICYRCQYTKKLEIFGKKPAKPIHTCMICKKTLPSCKWKYCSYECAKEGKTNLDKSYWTANVINTTPRKFSGTLKHPKNPRIGTEEDWEL